MADATSTQTSSTDDALRPSSGLVAVLDALGAADYSEERARHYLAARTRIQALVSRYAEERLSQLWKDIPFSAVKWFVFQDTVILAYESPHNEVTLKEIVWFAHLLRVFQASGLEEKLLFRGAVAAGAFYKVDPVSNAILGPAVRDAARWYARADWIGIHATPRTTLTIQALLDVEGNNVDFVLVPFDVPLKAPTAERTMRLQSVNWPKMLHLMHPDKTARQIRGGLQSAMAHDDIPVGAEQKHFNALSFFDSVIKAQKLEEPYNRRNKDRGPSITIESSGGWR